MTATTAPVVTIGAVTFNLDDVDILDGLEGWHDAPGRDAPIIPRGGTVGAVPGGPFLAKEKYLVATGTRLGASSADAMAKRRELLQQFKDDSETELRVNWGGVTLSTWVQCYDVAGITMPDGLAVRFRLPLVQFDPYRYGQPISANVGAYTGLPFYRAYSINTTPDPDKGYRVYTGTKRQYVQQVSASPLPMAATITNDGDVATSRVLATVTGPLDQGDWWLVNESTGDLITVDLPLVAGQSIYFDMHEETVHLNSPDGDPVNEYVRGQWLRLPAGESTLRLGSGTANPDAFAAFTVYPAYL